MKGMPVRRRWQRLTHRFDRFVVRHLYPQRPFLTFAPGAVMHNVTLAEENGVLVIHVGAKGLVQGVNGYDTRVILDAGADLRDGLLRARHAIDPLVLCNPAPESTISGSTLYTQ